MIAVYLFTTPTHIVKRINIPEAALHVSSHMDMSRSRLLISKIAEPLALDKKIPGKLRER
jgi:hypothetical protein